MMASWMNRRRRRHWLAGALWLLTGLVLGGWTMPGLAQTPSPEDVYQSVLPSVVTLEAETRGGAKSMGAGFLAIREGVVATAWHLVQDAKKVVARFADGAAVEIEGVLDWDEVRDIVLLKVKAPGRPLCRLCPGEPSVGARAYVIGAPRGFEFSISDGLVSQIQIIDGFPQCQISCPISPGNSGGPVLNARGEVLGVVSWSKKDAQNLNFATPSKCLLQLDAASPVTPWKALSRHRRADQARSVAQREQERLVPAPAESGLEALRALLHQAAGEEVTVTVSRGHELRAFKVKLPGDLVK